MRFLIVFCATLVSSYPHQDDLHQKKEEAKKLEFLDKFLETHPIYYLSQDLLKLTRYSDEQSKSAPVFTVRPPTEKEAAEVQTSTTIFPLTTSNSSITFSIAFKSNITAQSTTYKSSSIPSSTPSTTNFSLLTELINTSIMTTEHPVDPSPPVSTEIETMLDADFKTTAQMMLTSLTASTPATVSQQTVGTFETAQDSTSTTADQVTTVNKILYDSTVSSFPSSTVSSKLMPTTTLSFQDKLSSASTWEEAVSTFEPSKSTKSEVTLPSTMDELMFTNVLDVNSTTVFPAVESSSASTTLSPEVGISALTSLPLEVESSSVSRSSTEAVSLTDESQNVSLMSTATVSPVDKSTTESLTSSSGTSFPEVESSTASQSSTQSVSIEAETTEKVIEKQSDNSSSDTFTPEFLEEMNDLMKDALEHSMRLARQEDDGETENYTEPTFKHFVIA